MPEWMPHCIVCVKSFYTFSVRCYNLLKDNYLTLSEKKILVIRL